MGGTSMRGMQVPTRDRGARFLSGVLQKIFETWMTRTWEDSLYWIWCHSCIVKARKVPDTWLPSVLIVSIYSDTVRRAW